jgi:hypothetical protein
MELTGTQILDGVSTDYPLLEDVPPGTKTRISVTTAGAVTIACNVMARYQY